MNVDAQTLLEGLEGRLAASRIADLTAELRQLPSAEVFSLAQQANLSITSDGNIVGNNNISIVVKGEVRRAIGYYEQRLQIAREIGDRRGEGQARWNMALAWESLGDRAQAIACAEAALLLFEQIEDPNAAMVRQQLAEWKTTQPNERETL